MRLGISIGSGTYSLMLLFLVCEWEGSCCVCFDEAVLPGKGTDVNPTYVFRLVGVDAIGPSRLVGDMQSPGCWLEDALSRDVRLASFFHGPGESLASSGEGRGVTSPIAEMTGLG